MGTVSKLRAENRKLDEITIQRQLSEMNRSHGELKSFVRKKSMIDTTTVLILSLIMFSLMAYVLMNLETIPRASDYWTI